MAAAPKAADGVTANTESQSHHHHAQNVDSSGDFELFSKATKAKAGPKVHSKELGLTFEVGRNAAWSFGCESLDKSSQKVHEWSVVGAQVAGQPAVPGQPQDLCQQGHMDVVGDKSLTTPYTIRLGKDSDGFSPGSKFKLFPDDAGNKSLPRLSWVKSDKGHHHHHEHHQGRKTEVYTLLRYRGQDKQMDEAGHAEFELHSDGRLGLHAFTLNEHAPEKPVKRELVFVSFLWVMFFEQQTLTNPMRKEVTR